jgi:hypothetical protein
MNDNLAIERANLYETFYETSKDIEVEIDSEEVWIADGQVIDELADDIISTFHAGGIGTDYKTLRIIAAIAFYDSAAIEAFDYFEWGGEKYEDD